MMADGKPGGSAKGRPGRRRAGNKRSAAPKNEDAAQRKAALEASTRKKIELEKKALHIVEQLLEENITEEFLLNSGRCITPSHYKDIVDERSIIKLCGYPVCQNKLENVPKQKYRISTRTNRVYDITERKCFCSNFCYRASKYFEAQISKSPVWMREEEIPSDIELLKKGQSGQSGEEVKLCDEVIKASDIENPRVSSNPCESASYGTASDSSSDTEQEFVSSVLPRSQSSSASLAQQLHRNSILKKKDVQKVCSSPKSEDSDVVEVTEQLSNCKLGAQEEMHACTVQKKITATPSKNATPGKSNASENCENTSSNSQIVFLGVSQKGAEYLKMLANSKQRAKIEPRDSVPTSAAKHSLLELLKQTLTEWRTEETLKFLYGPNYTLCSLECLSSANQENEELDEDDLDTPEDLNAAVGKSENSLNYSLPFMGSGETVKPVPSYEKLKEETEFLQLRVREFYKGKCILAEEELAHTQTDEHSSTDKDDQQQDLTFPLVDSNAQMQIRKRIVLEKLRKALPAVLGPLQITLGDVYTELKNLVKTFRLTNRNIIHKMPEWTLIAIVLLSVLSQNIPVFKSSQRSPAYTQFLTTLLGELHFKNEDLESLTRIFRADSPPE